MKEVNIHIVSTSPKYTAKQNLTHRVYLYNVGLKLSEKPTEHWQGIFTQLISENKENEPIPILPKLEFADDTIILTNTTLKTVIRKYLHVLIIVIKKTNYKINKKSKENRNTVFDFENEYQNDLGKLNQMIQLSIEGNIEMPPPNSVSRKLKMHDIIIKSVHEAECQIHSSCVMLRLSNVPQQRWLDLFDKNRGKYGMHVQEVKLAIFGDLLHIYSTTLKYIKEKELLEKIIYIFRLTNNLFNETAKLQREQDIIDVNKEITRVNSSDSGFC